MSSQLKLAIQRAKRSGGKALDLSNQGLDEIPDQIYSQLPNLQELNLSRNQLISIDSALFQTFSQLRSLDLSKNSIAFLPEILLNFAKKGTLKSLKLQKNPVSNKNPNLSVLSGEQNILNQLKQYFGGKSVGPKMQTSSSSINFLNDDDDCDGSSNDVLQLKKKISELSVEVSRYKAAASSGKGSMEQSKGEEINKLTRLQSQNSKLRSQIAQLNYQMNGQNMGSNELFSSIKGLAYVNQKQIKTGKQIAQGGFSVILQGIWSGTQVAVKKIFDPVITQELKQEMQNQVKMLHYLRHPNIVLLMGVNPDISNIMIVTEFVPNGTLFDLLHNSTKQIPVKKRYSIAFEIALTYKFIHDAGVVHRDVKTYNVILDNSLHIKICDFGLARFKKDLNTGSSQFSGTPAYMPPQMFQKMSYDEKVDIFSFGTMLWEIVTRQVPYDGLDPADIRSKVLKGECLKHGFGGEKKINQLIDSCRSLQPSQRPSFGNIVDTLRQFL